MAWGHSLVAVLKLLIAVVSLVWGRRLGPGFSSCGEWGLVTTCHLVSSQSRDQTLGPCIGRLILFFFGRQILNH